MAYKSVFNGVIFIEGNEKHVKSFGQIEYKKDKFYNSQFQNIDRVKNQLAEKVKALGGNAIINFKYGQKNTSWFKSILLSLDDNINWFGNGEVVLLDEETYKEIIEYFNNQN